MVADKELVSQPNMVMQLRCTLTNTTRELALPEGLTYEEVVEYVKKYQGKYEELNGVYQYKFSADAF